MRPAHKAKVERARPRNVVVSQRSSSGDEDGDAHGDGDSRGRRAGEDPLDIGRPKAAGAEDFVLNI